MDQEGYTHLSEFMAFLNVFNKETERGVALTALAMIDDLLGRVLRSFLIDNEGTTSLLDVPFAPIGTLAAKTAAAYAMGLISTDERREIDILRKSGTTSPIRSTRRSRAATS